MSQRKNVIRVGDTVKLLRPLWVKRVGYRLHYEDLMDEVRNDPRTLDALITLGIANPLLHRDAIPRNFVEAVARLRVEQRGFGGRERVVVYGPLSWNTFAQPDESYVGRHYQVLGKRTAYTGRYQPAHQINSWDEPTEWANAEIVDKKAVVLLDLGLAEVEATNVEKVWGKEVEVRLD